MRLPIYILITLIIFSLLSCEKKKETNFTLQKSRLKYSFIATQNELLARIEAPGSNYMNKVGFFSNLPSQFALEDCQSAWKDWYNQFLLLSPYRYFESDFNIGFDENQSYFDLSGINYGYVDYTDAQPNGGIIKDEINYPTINQVGMISWHQQGDEKNAAIGFHVLEFLLWGEDLSTTSAGERDNTDYLQTNSENQRRMDYLVDASGYLKLIVNQLEVSTTYENSILSADSDIFFTHVIEGYTRFIEEDLIENTILIPLNSQDPSEELSDFSDNTMANINAKVRGLSYMLDGSDLFMDSDGEEYFMIDFISHVDEDLAESIMNSLDRISDLLSQINVEFENAIINVSTSTKLNSIVTELDKISSALGRVKQNYFS